MNVQTKTREVCLLHSSAARMISKISDFLNHSGHTSDPSWLEEKRCCDAVLMSKHPRVSTLRVRRSAGETAVRTSSCSEPLSCCGEGQKSFEQPSLFGVSCDDTVSTPVKVWSSNIYY